MNNTSAILDCFSTQALGANKKEEEDWWPIIEDRTSNCALKDRRKGGNYCLIRTIKIQP